jgi:hypothetical protein
MRSRARRPDLEGEASVDRLTGFPPPPVDQFAIPDYVRNQRLREWVTETARLT